MESVHKSRHTLNTEMHFTVNLSSIKERRKIIRKLCCRMFRGGTGVWNKTECSLHFKLEEEQKVKQKGTELQSYFKLVNNCVIFWQFPLYYWNTHIYHFHVKKRERLSHYENNGNIIKEKTLKESIWLPQRTQYFLIPPLLFSYFLLTVHTYRKKESVTVWEENRNGNSEHCTERKVNYRTKDGRNVKNVSK